MPFMGPRHHGLIRPPAVSLLTPVLVGFASSSVGDPTVPVHQAGDKLVSISASGNPHGDVPPSVASWDLWLDVFGGTSRSLAIYRTTAAAPGTTCAWTGATTPRSVWVWRDADFDTASVLDGTSATEIDWTNLPSMAEDCLVAAYALVRNTQTDISSIDLAGFNARVTKEAAHAGWAGDSDPTLLDSFDPPNDTLDTISGGHITAAYSMKGAPA